MVTDPQTLAMYAALAEIVYRRDSVNDQALSFVDDIAPLAPAGADFIVDDAVAGVTVTGQDGNQLVTYTDLNGDHYDLATDGKYYYSDRAFVGTIVKVGSQYVVVFRGTDATLSGWSGAMKSVFDQKFPLTNFEAFKDWFRSLYDDNVDFGDAYTNGALGFGTYEASQWDDARALTQKAIDLAIADGGSKADVVVVGQSLGGGLAGLASAYFDIKGVAIAPAPFLAQLENIAIISAVAEIESKTPAAAAPMGRPAGRGFVGI